jgi:carbon monoxide dehydrogenase subunit G
MEWTQTQNIDAPPEVVWELATDVASWPEYMSTVQTVERVEGGPLRLGASAMIKQPGQRKALWTVTEFTPGRTFSWVSQRRGMAMTGSHRVEPEGAGARSTLTLTMSGPLAPILGPVLGPLMRRVLRTENACFAERAQAQARRAPHAG